MSEVLTLNPFIERRRFERAESAGHFAKFHFHRKNWRLALYGMAFTVMITGTTYLAMKPIQIGHTAMILTPGPESNGFYRWNGFHRVAPLVGQVFYWLKISE
jgi:hypothetical protein